MAELLQFMILLVDIGNTNINFAVADRAGRIVSKGAIPTASLYPDTPINRGIGIPPHVLTWKGSRIKKGATCMHVGLHLKPILANIKKRNKIGKVTVVSVVPRVLERVKNDLEKTFEKATLSVVGKNITVPIKCVYNRRQIGQDRLVTAFAAKSLYGLPILIIDFGTAVTFDAVSKGGTYLGGLILPGIKMSLESLAQKTAMLPKTYLRKTRSFIGKDTHSSIRNGISYGYASMCDGLIKLFRRKIDKNLRVIATGGDARLISCYTRSVKKVDPDLAMKGLYLLSK